MRRALKKMFYKSVLIMVVAVGILFSPLARAQEEALSKPLTRKQALIIAEQTLEVQGFYGLQDGSLVNCIEKEVVRPCDSDWVTCIDNAWVVKLWAGESCPVKHDGRLSVVIVINDQTGEIISRFPERYYFEQPQYCLENYDCVCQSDKNSGNVVCLNFIHALMSGLNNEGLAPVCGNNKCSYSLPAQ